MNTKRLEGWLILVVDDDADSSEVAERTLQFFGAEVHAAISGAAALVWMQTHDPDLVLLDISMPGMSGYEVLETLRADHPDLPIAALTAHAMSADKARGLEAGFDAYITKPISVLTFVDELFHEIPRLKENK